MDAKHLGRAVYLQVLVIRILSAQEAREHDSLLLKISSAPLYWQATHAAEDVRATATAATSIFPLGSNALVFVGMTPCRVVDTRTTQGFPEALFCTEVD
jgi:hypothetical protein